MIIVPIPARRAIVGAGLALLALGAAIAAPSLAALAVLMDVLILAAMMLDARRAAAIRLEARRTWPPLLVQGEAATVEVAVAATAPATVLAREALHPGLADGPLRERLEVSPPREAVWRYAVVPRRRGSHRVGPLSVRVLGPWGFAWAQRDLLAPEVRRVYPQTRWEGRVGRLLVLAHRRELGRVPLRTQGAGSEPYALREYRSGDPPGRIQWKASARHDRLLSREDTWERGTRLVILLDCARAMTSLDGTRSKLDHALAAALALTRVAASRGDRTTLVGFSDRVERVVRVGSGARAMSLAYGALYDLQARLTEPAYDLATETVMRIEPRRAAVVLITSTVDIAAAELLRAALLRLRRRHRPVLVNLQDPGLVRLALGIPDTAAAAFAKVSALEILLANRRLGEGLQRAGIRVAAAAADQLAWRTLQSYLGLLDVGRSGVGAQRSDSQSSGQTPLTTSISEPSLLWQTRPVASPQKERTPV